MYHVDWLLLILSPASCPTLIESSSTEPPLQRCYVGNCTSLEDCRREELISECSSRDYDACITTIVQKGKERRGWRSERSEKVHLSAYGRVTVVKRCGESESCGSSEHYWWQDECDRKSDEDSYTCSTCCSHSTCNSARALSTPTLHRLAGLFLSLYISLNKSSNSCRSLSFLPVRTGDRIYFYLDKNI